MTEILAIYGAVLSTILAIPAILKQIKKNIKPLRFICKSFTAQVLEKGQKTSMIKDLFDISIVNTTNEKIYLSEIEIELKHHSENGKLISTLFQKNKFDNVLEPKESFQKFGMCSDLLSNKENPKHVRYYEKFRFIVENSEGKVIKSKWFRHEIIINHETAKWEILSEKEFQKNLS